MKEYFFAIVAVVSVGSIIISLNPGGNAGKNIRLLCGLCTAGCVILPLLGFVMNGELPSDEWSELFDEEPYRQEYYDEIYNNMLVDVENKNADILLESKIIQALSISKDEFDVHIVVENKSDEKFIERVDVTIYSQGLDIDPRKIENYVYELLGCGCIIYYDL